MRTKEPNVKEKYFELHRKQFFKATCSQILYNIEFLFQKIQVMSAKNVFHVMIFCFFCCAHHILQIVRIEICFQVK